MRNMVESRNILARLFHPLYMIGVYLFLYVPLVVLVLFSFNDSSMSVQWAGFSLRWYKQLLITPEIISALGVSLVVALCSTLLSVVLGTALVFASKWWRPRFLFELFLPNVILPEIILALGLLSLFVFLKIPLGYGSLIAGHTLLGLGFVIPIVRARFRELDPLLTEASADLGATPPQTFRKIVIPLLMPSIIAASLLVFTLSLDDFFIAFFCSGARIETLSIYVFSKVREGIDPSVNAIAAILLAVSSLFILIVSYLEVLDQVISHE